MTVQTRPTPTQEQEGPVQLNVVNNTTFNKNYTK